MRAFLSELTLTAPIPYGGQVRELQALVAPKTPQVVLVRGHAGLVINKPSNIKQVKVVRAQAVLSRVGFNNRYSNAEVA